MTAPVSSWTRHDLWCNRCMASTRMERDVFEGETLVATLQGCTRCKTGMCAEPDQVEEQRLKDASEFWDDALRTMPRHAPTCALLTTHHLTCTCGAYGEARSGQ